MSLECECGTELFEPDDEGRYTPDTEAWCPDCGRKNIIGVAQRFNDDGPYDVACAVTLDEEVISVGQPICDGSGCGGSEDWVRQNPAVPCQLDCKRVTDEMRARFAGAVMEQKP